MRDKIIAQLQESAEVKVKTAETLAGLIVQAVNLIVNAYQNGGKVLLMGNGGSAADAQHIAGEFVGRFRKERQALPAVALSTDTSILTALGNDYGFDFVFARQVEALAHHPRDVLVAISTSGNSPNVLRAVEEGKKRNLRVIGFLGRGGGKLKDLVDCALVVPSDDTQRIQEVHITMGHIICDLVEQELFP